MVIQRLQSLYLLLSSIMMGIFCHLPLATQGGTGIYPYQQPVYLTLNVLIVILSLIAIFLFKNFSRQQMVVKVNIFLIVVSAVTSFVMLYNNISQIEIVWTAGPLLLICSFIITIAALRRIKHDENLLKAADRIR